MKPKYLAAALVVVTALCVFDGCAEPEPVAKNPAANNAKETVARAPMTPESTNASNSIAPESRNRAAESVADSRPSITGRPASVDRDQPESNAAQPDAGESTNAARNGAIEGGNIAADAVAKRPSPDIARATPKKEFKLEFVSATGKEGLNPGDTIPNIEGKDIDGIKFQLDDYKGKVIMIDFWGDW